MSIAGNLKTMELTELLQWLSQGRKTGTLVIDNGQIKKEVLFLQGRIISSTSSDPKEQLGHFLVSHGFINEVELSNAIQMQERSGMLLGKILLTLGAISEADLERLLQLKAEEALYGLFSWKEGEFRFLDGQLPEEAFAPLDLEVTGIVLEGVRRQDEWRRIREVVRSSRSIPVSMVASFDEIDLDPGERQILALVDDQRTVEEISLQTHSSEFHVCRVLFGQVLQGRIKVITPPWPAAAEPPPTPSAVDAGSLIEAAHKHLDQNAYEQALRHLRAARSLEPESKPVQKAAEQEERRLIEALEREGVTPASVPVLSAELEELTASKISPQEGFMLTRINGSYDIASIVKISPIPQLDALLVFWRLARAGHICFQ